MSAACPLPSGGTLPGFLASLDPERMRDLVERNLLAEGAVLASLRPDYVRYKELDGAIVGWTLETRNAGATYETYVTARSAAPWRLRSEAERLRNRAGESYRGLRSLALLDEEELLLLAFPIDRVLRDLRRMLRARKIRILVRAECPELETGVLKISKHASEGWLVRYKPERRAVLRWRLALTDEGEHVVERRGLYVRLHAEPVGTIAADAMRSAADAGLRCPEPLAVPHARLVVETELAGQPPAVLDAGHALEAGKTLATLHASELPASVPRHAAVRELDLCLRTSADFGKIDPSLGALADSVTDRLARWIPKSGQARLLHGDFHRGQLLFRGDEVESPGLVDFDRAVVGSPAHDIAAFWAHETERDPDGARSLGEALEDGYGRVREGCGPEELSWYKACAMLRFAMTPFRRLAPDWPERARFLLERAVDWASGAGG